MTETSELLKTAVQAAKAGDREKAHQLLLQIVEQDEKNETAWLWLSGTVQTKEDRQICLENVLAINPNNQIAQKGLKKLGIPLPQPAPPPAPEEKSPERWDQPVYDVELPEANNPHQPNFEDAWSSSANLCAYCAQPVQRSDKRCPKCHRKMVGKEFVYPQRSLYLVIWVILRSLNHVLALLLVFLVGGSLSELPPEIPMYVPAYWITAFVVLLLQIGFTVALFFRQIWAYWLAILGVILMVLSTVALAFLSVPVQPTAVLPAWLVVPCASFYILVQVLYVFMIVMAGGDFKREQQWRVATADPRIKDPLVLDKAGKLFAQRGMWATAVLYWQRAVGRSPGNVAILRRLADGYARLGFADRGLDTLRQAHDKTLNPDTKAELTRQIELLSQKTAQPPRA